MQRVLDNIEELIPIGESFVLYVTGYSMLPLLGYGRDHIIVRRTDNEEPILGRIAMFRTPDRHIIVHRVVRIEGDVVILQGDGNPYAQERCKRSEIVGVVDAVVRQNKRVVSCTTPQWRRRERIWLCQPAIVRRYALAIIRRWREWTKPKKSTK